MPLRAIWEPMESNGCVCRDRALDQLKPAQSKKTAAIQQDWMGCGVKWWITYWTSVGLHVHEPCKCPIQIEILGDKVY
jgi:hypothetical protein